MKEQEINLKGINNCEVCGLIKKTQNLLQYIKINGFFPKQLQNKVNTRKRQKSKTRLNNAKPVDLYNTLPKHFDR